ncbi:hypothetical protein FB45DRAFT_931663 [Roridomyces roridus]|uniref:Uncharacterized protein n=1 Tax=Roridomyces roridus TaxID=1738132 RepID=A0AAD7FG53_9AGAR|nr:hypothetical protein FB45DRAFT_931663 [Roridomyces roridus]
MDPCSRTLRITEIVRMICEESAATTYGPSYTKQPPRLPRLACTSKIFLEPALDLIWEELESIVPLVKCMPPTVWEQQGDGRQQMIVLRRPIVSADLSRLLFYSVRVRKLNFDLSHASWLFPIAVHPEVLQALSMSLASQIIMPKIRRLDWNPGKDALPLTPRLLGPDIRNLRISLDQSNASLSLLPCIKASCSIVTSFSLSFNGEAVRHPTLGLITDALTGWHNLEALTVPNLDLAALKHISRLPSLTNLNLFNVAGAESRTLRLEEHLTGPSFPLPWPVDSRPPPPHF